MFPTVVSEGPVMERTGQSTCLVNKCRLNYKHCDVRKTSTPAGTTWRGHAAGVLVNPRFPLYVSYNTHPRTRRHTQFFKYLDAIAAAAATGDSLFRSRGRDNRVDVERPGQAYVRLPWRSTKGKPCTEGWAGGAEARELGTKERTKREKDGPTRYMTT